MKMKSKLNTIITLPIIHLNKKTHHNFYSVCIKAIENNKEGVLNKNECIKNILKLKEEKLKEQNKKYYDKSFLISNPSLKNLRVQKRKVINKRRTLSQILSENEILTKINFKKIEKIPKLKKNISSTILDIEEKKQNQEKEINKKEFENKRMKHIQISSNEINKDKNKINNSKEKTKKKIPKRYHTFKRIMEYLESNNIPLFEILNHNPFQKKPYQISKGYEFLEAVKFQNYKFVREALQTSNDFLFVFDYYGQTCYHWAAKLGNIKMLTLLMEYGLHHNQKDFKGRTPLYLAAVNNNRKVCDFLLRNKANIHLKDNFGNSASDVAGSKELKYYLGDIMTQPYSNPIYKKKIIDFMKKRDKNIEEARNKKRLKEIEEEHKYNISEYNEENEEN